ncbi:hypothetical protein HDU91_002383, partial [Kappamyces sp. JEL0680]
MMAANLVGFAVGVEGLMELLEQLFHSKGLYFMAVVGLSLFGGVHRMFWLREQERLNKAKLSR